MKSLLFFFLLGFGTIIAQENGLRKTYIQEGELIKFSEYYENGQLAQTGFLLDGKNHGVWQSFDINGAKKPTCTYLELLLNYLKKNSQF